MIVESENGMESGYCLGTVLFSELKNPQPDLLIHDAIQKIKLTHGGIRIKDLVATLHISQDSFEKRFRRVIGTSPKQFSSIIRLRNIIDNYSTSTSLTDMAYTAGYFDQAHFIKDFKSFIWLAPQDFFKTASYW